jgi:hypothetical protein
MSSGYRINKYPNFRIRNIRTQTTPLLLHVRGCNVILCKRHIPVYNRNINEAVTGIHIFTGICILQNYKKEYDQRGITITTGNWEFFITVDP